MCAVRLDLELVSYLDGVRLTALRVANVGGLQDCAIILGEHRLLAFAGANGTGKSKLLSCLLAPWTQTLPAAADPERPVEVNIGVHFDSAELGSLEDFDREAGWGQGRPPSEVTLNIHFRPMAGFQLTTEPHNIAITQAFTNAQFLQKNPSCNLVYLPAERRLLPSNTSALDLSQLAEEVAIQRLAEARNTSHNYGRLDDQEFENYAKALCVAGSLPSELQSDSEAEDDNRSRWDQFKEAVDAVISPKVLLPLTRENPSDLYIEMPGGRRHRVPELSSGERQALIIISRVFRAGEGQSLIAIDEPDAYLHPSLSARLLNALRSGLQDGGRMFVATHSPSILDSIPPDAIYRLSYDAPPALVETEDERLSLYREAGFRASALTQASLLVVVEGDYDSTVLPQLVPELGSAAIRVAEGRSQVFKTVEALSGYDLPILGVVDADVFAEAPNSSIAGRITIWPAADIEGTILQEDSCLDEMVAGKLVKAEYQDKEKLKATIRSHLENYRDQAIAEMTQRSLRNQTNIAWPSPRGDDPLARLRAMAGGLPQLEGAQIEAAIAAAESEWKRNSSSLWTLVRGKWILPALNREISEFRTGDALMSALLARQPQIVALKQFAAQVVQTAKR